VSVPMTLSDP